MHVSTMYHTPYSKITLHYNMHTTINNSHTTLKSQPISRTVVMHLIGDSPCGWGLAVGVGFGMLININPAHFCSVAPDVVSLFLLVYNILWLFSFSILMVIMSIVCIAYLLMMNKSFKNYVVIKEAHCQFFSLCTNTLSFWLQSWYKTQSTIF